MKHLRPLFLLAALIALFAAACGGSSSSSIPSDAVAVVGGKTISKGEFDGLMAQAKKARKAQGQQFPKVGTREYSNLRDEVVKFLVQRAEREDKAKSDLGITISDKKVADRLKQIKKQYFGGSEAKYKEQLRKQGLTDEEVRATVKDQLISQEIFNKVTAKITVSDKDVQAYYKQHKDQYGQPASRDVRHILVKKRALAFQIYKQVKNGGNWAVLAKKYSQDPSSRLQGGKYTAIKGRSVPQFDRVAFSLKTKEISPPVQTQYGWHVIQALTPIKPAKSPPYSQVKEAIKQQLLQTKKNKAMTDWVNNLNKEFAKKVSYQTGFAPLTTSTSSSTSTTG